MNPQKAKNAEFFRLQKEAKERCGEAASRPQDSNFALMKDVRRTNSGYVSFAPANYQESLYTWIEEMEILPISSTAVAFSNEMVTWVQDYLSLVAEIKRLNFKKEQVIAVDFEFHSTDAYDSFICVASISVPHATLVIDCISRDRREICQELTKLLQSCKRIKPMHGSDNDLIRVLKDWECHPAAVVDCQDLFQVWKQINPTDCLQTCTGAIRRKLASRFTPTGTTEVENWLWTTQNPGLEFLIDVFFPEAAPTAKDKIVTYADWRLRPLPKQLMTYAAQDSFYTLCIFQKLVQKVGLGGFKDAAKRSVRKIGKVGQLPKYNLVPGSTSSNIEKKVSDWRDYLGRILDRNPTKVLSDRNAAALTTHISFEGYHDIDGIATLLKKFKLPDNDVFKAAKLLTVYLDPDQTKKESMKNIICHNCCKEGHTAKFCPFETNKEKQKEFNRTVNAEFHLGQQERRWRNICNKFGWDYEGDRGKKGYEWSLKTASSSSKRE